MNCISLIIMLLSLLIVLDSASDTILSPSLCLPRSPEAAVMRSHAGLNLLFCLHTLATSSSSFSSEAFISRSMKAFSVDDYHCLSRFNCECVQMHS